jgi:hypothetical protein
MWYRKAKMMIDRNAFEKMAAAGMSRLLQHMVSGPFAILSADRVGMTPQDMREARRRLKSTLRDLGYGFVDTKGAWREETGEYAHEGSVFVPGMRPEEAEQLGRALNQESVIVGEDGKFSFMNLMGEETSHGGTFDLSDTLRIPDPTEAPEMYTQIGNRKFEFRLDEDPDDMFHPERVQRLRQQFDALPSPRPPVHEDAFVAHSYAGKPPPMMPKFGVRLAGSGQSLGNLQVVEAMSTYVPFVAKLREDQPRFDPSPRWGEPVPVPVRGTGVRTASLMDLDEFVPGEFEAYEEALGNISKFRGGVPALFTDHNPGHNIKGFDSLYVGPSGDVFLLQPHQHNETARRVLRTVHPDLPLNLVKGHLAGGYSHTDLTRVSGIQRIQIYPDGMGVTIEMSRPPNRAQLDAIRDTYSMTPMERFVAEINLDGKNVAHLTSFSQLVHFVNNWNPDDPSSVEALNPMLSGLYDRRR